MDLTCTVTGTTVVTMSCGLGNDAGVVEDRIGIAMACETVIGTVDVIPVLTDDCVVLAVVGN